jgi:hypothetical protein
MLVARTLKVALLLVLVTGTVAFALARSEPVEIESAHHHMLGIAAHQDDADVDAKIENAMSAAPLSIAENAAIMDNALEEDGSFVLLREGSNGWYCFPDLPGTPGNDPICMDETFLVWNYAIVNGTEPEITTMGLAYMLQGGSDPSNTDPFAMEPAEGEEWITTPPHVMIVLPDELDQTLFSTDHGYGGPYIMWAGTPYEHIMMPIAEMDNEHNE